MSKLDTNDEYVEQHTHHFSYKKTKLIIIIIIIVIIVVIIVVHVDVPTTQAAWIKGQDVAKDAQ